MNGQITLAFPNDINEDLKRLWIDTAGEAFKQIAEQQKTPRYMNQSMASKYMGVSENFFKDHIKVSLPQIIVGGVTRYDRIELDKFYQEHKN